MRSRGCDPTQKLPLCLLEPILVFSMAYDIQVVVTLTLYLFTTVVPDFTLSCFFFSFPACSCTRIVKRYWWGKGAPRRLNTAGIKSAVKWTRSWFLQAIVYCLRRKSRSQTGARCVTVKEPCLSCGPPPKNGKGKCGDLAAKCGLA